MGWETILTNANVDNYSHSHTYNLANLDLLGASTGEILKVEEEGFELFSIYYLSLNGEWELANATMDAYGASSILGLALSFETLLISGYVNIPTINGAPGKPLFLGTNPGELSHLSPYNAGNVVRILGYYLSDYTEGATEENFTTIKFNPDSIWIELSVNE